MWRHNNRKDIIAITGQGINDPDLIYPGQKLLLPMTNSKQSNKTNINAREFIPNDAKKKHSLKEALKNIKTPMAVKYNLEEMSLPAIVHPNAIVEVKMKGNVILTSKKSLAITYVANKSELEIKRPMKQIMLLAHWFQILVWHTNKIQVKSP
ncbi:hypothetical protein [Thalassomonas haliotis]|uniref:hypothetical protein n=1 Tax=Thalassomonas haliotis TaxID=485448 RepID=UPI00236251C0|nr:hypothetical protein [Thalassomonas haliotis]